MKSKIQKIVQINKDWVKRNLEHIQSRVDKKFPLCLSDESPVSLVSVPGYLMGLAIINGKQALGGQDNRVDISKISQSIAYHAWSTEFTARFYFNFPSLPQSDMTHTLSRIACIICCSPEWTPKMEKILRKIMSREDSYNHEHWESCVYEPFVLACLNMQSGEPVDFSLIKDPYREVLENLSNPKKCSEALVIACDFHMNQLDLIHEQLYPEFEYNPFDYLPCEYLLVQRLRRSLGYEEIDVDHELVHFYNTSIGSIPPPPPARELPYIEDCIAAFEKHGL
jgi:hypothetical protein